MRWHFTSSKTDSTKLAKWALYLTFPETHLSDISWMILLIIKHPWEALKYRLQINGARGFFHVACVAQIGSFGAAFYREMLW